MTTNRGTTVEVQTIYTSEGAIDCIVLDPEVLVEATSIKEGRHYYIFNTANKSCTCGLYETHGRCPKRHEHAAMAALIIHRTTHTVKQPLVSLMEEKKKRVTRTPRSGTGARNKAPNRRGAAPR